jgi:hypothetical protein
MAKGGAVILKISHRMEECQIFLKTALPFKENPSIGITVSQRSQRDVFYLGWPIAPLYMSPNAGGEGLLGLSQWVQLYTRAQINFGEPTPYLTYAVSGSLSLVSLKNPNSLL